MKGDKNSTRINERGLVSMHRTRDQGAGNWAMDIKPIKTEADYEARQQLPAIPALRPEDLA